MAAHRFTDRLSALTIFAALACLIAVRPASAHDKQTVWNYDGGVFQETDGSLSGGLCFRVSLRVTAPDFFDNLKRYDNPGVETVFRRGKETVTQFPGLLYLQFVIHDLPCSLKLQDTGSRSYLTRAIVSELHLSLYWKHGLELRSVTDFTPVDFSVRPIFPFNRDAKDLPERLEWNYALGSCAPTGHSDEPSSEQRLVP